MVYFYTTLSKHAFGRFLRTSDSHWSWFASFCTACVISFVVPDVEDIDEETADVCRQITHALQLREKYVHVPPPTPLPSRFVEPAVFDPSSVSCPEASEVARVLCMFIFSCGCSINICLWMVSMLFMQILMVCLCQCIHIHVMMR